MADTKRTLAALQALLADNAIGDISAQDVRDMLVSVFVDGISGAVQFGDGQNFSSDASNLFWDDVNKRLGIGNATPAAPVDVVGDINTSTEFTIGGTSKLTATTLGSLVVTSSLTTVGALNSGSITSGFGSIDIGSSAFDTTGAVSAGDVDVSGGIHVGGTGAANYFTDYEEGNWTPSDQSGATLTFVTPSGRYTKIGRMVFASFELVYPVTADGSNALIGSLPFTSKAEAVNGMNSGSVTYVSSVGTVMTSNVLQNTTNIRLQYAGSSTATNVYMSGATITGMVIYTV